ncbi:MAG: competence/damage-inducible protein A [Clostridiales bacterium]|nr:competence/damage-inducible protein A [Eubacteriales bacterium]MDH7565070.1 competence/damage-inducible protein A [Clostridiales bacterium]
MNAEILAVGTELLMGQIANTNAQYISKRLPEVGVNVYYHSVVGDNPNRLKECLNLALQRSDAVIMTGGLGPTQDDLTKETVAEIFNRKLVLHQESLEKIKGFFARLHREMTPNNVKQAYLPEHCKVIENSNGTAPGCIIEEGKKVVIMLPGPPSEMIPMFENTVMPYFLQKSSYRIESRYLRVFGIGESALEDMLLDLIEKQSNPTIAPYAKDGEVTLRITAKCEKNADAHSLLMPVVEEISRRIGNALYSIEDKNLEEVVGNMLIENNVSLSIAESCTGGLISGKITGIPGISRVFKSGVVSYSNEAKVNILGVRQETLDRYGAVSKETAVEMARGIRELAKSDLGLSVTGIAGPGGGTVKKPVGLVYVALAWEDGVKYKELKLWGNRERIRNVTSLHAFDMIRLHMISKNN